MATGATTGFTPARKLGNGPDNKGVSSYTIASGYATDIGKGDPVKFSAGTLVIGTNDAAVQGIFQSVEYIPTDVTARPFFGHKWSASTAATSIVAHIIDDPNATFTVKANGTVAQVKEGNIYAMDLTQGVDAYTGRSKAVVKVLALTTGSLAITGTNNAGLTNLENSDAFAVKSSVANVNTTITILTNQTPAQLLALINAVPGVSASLDPVTHYLTITATDGGSLVLTDGVGTPLADSNTFTGQTTTATITPTVIASAGMVKVRKVTDLENNVLEVYLVEDALRDNG